MWNAQAELVDALVAYIRCAQSNQDKSRICTVTVTISITPSIVLLRSPARLRPVSWPEKNGAQLIVAGRHHPHLMILKAAPINLKPLQTKQLITHLKPKYIAGFHLDIKRSKIEATRTLYTRPAEDASFDFGTFFRLQTPTVADLIVRWVEARQPRSPARPNSRS